LRPRTFTKVSSTSTISLLTYLQSWEVCVIVVIMFHKSHNIRNCPFCWSSSSFCCHNVFSINRISWYELLSRSTKVCRKNTKCMATMFLYQYTMCYMKCTTGELRACSIVLKTQYSLCNYHIRKDFMQNILCKFVYLLYQRPFIYSAIYHGSYMFGVC
jgi:hypothetical protein